MFDLVVCYTGLEETDSMVAILFFLYSCDVDRRSLQGPRQIRHRPGPNVSYPRLLGVVLRTGYPKHMRRMAQ